MCLIVALLSREDADLTCGAIYQTLPMGSFFEEKVPFDLISIKNEGFRFLLDDNYLK